MNVTLKKWNNKTAAVYQFTSTVLPNLQPAICNLGIFGYYFLNFVNNSMCFPDHLARFTSI